MPESARARVDDTDAQIESRVEEALDDAPGMDDSDVDVVSVNRGVVLLGGKAATMTVTQSDKFAWGDVEGEITDAAGKMVYRARVIESGSAGDKGDKSSVAINTR